MTDELLPIVSGTLLDTILITIGSFDRCIDRENNPQVVASDLVAFLVRHNVNPHMVVLSSAQSFILINSDKAFYVTEFLNKRHPKATGMFKVKQGRSKQDIPWGCQS
jgi:hypothetical protein